ncbi:30S ribosome-binding factor RbfA [Candidatus Karelsulcia muelleri]|uniref:30S ribosome-binding factor RbfA n=1 Tax=Candidatus Karelsulcia muelleri TaxID=336810 RepID=UPI000D7C10E9|nr:30S ribosome-binding factor RbfA [Candidatus Karelsulcia muelleri]
MFLSSLKKKRAAILIKKEISSIFNRKLIYSPHRIFIIITQVILNSDFSLAKIFISFFPKKNQYSLIKKINKKSKFYKKILFQNLRFNFKKMPNISFYIDDSLEYIEKINKALIGKEENPLKRKQIIK